MDPRMKKVFLYISIGIVLLAIPISVFLVGKNQEIRKRATPASTLSFAPTAKTTKVGETFSLEVKIDAATNQVGIVQLRMVYDPAFLEAVDITNGPLAPSISVSKKIDPNGKVSISVGAKSNAQPIIGSGTIAVLTMKAIKASAAPVSIKFTPSPDTAANAIGEGANDVLVGRSPASVIIHNADDSVATVSTESIAALTPTASPSAATTLAPTLSPTPEDASESATATTSALVIISPAQNENVTTETPAIQGTGMPGSSITLTIHSSGTQTVVVTVDQDGNWIYTPQTPLAAGPHTVTALITDPVTGATQTTTATFVVASAGSSTPATESAIPVSGSTQTTILLITIGILLLISGAFVPRILQ